MWLLRIIDIPKSNPDAQRRSRLLNIILSGFFLLTSLGLLFGIINQIFNPNSHVEETAVTLVVTIVLLISLSSVYLLNYFYSQTVAATVFLLLFTGILFFSDTPQETFWGRNMVTLVVPIITASVILRPAASFIVAAVIGLIFVIFPQVYTPLSPDLAFGINFIGILTFFGIALISWLAAATLETTLTNLRVLNEELDLRVAHRTNELEITNSQLRQARDVALEASRYKSELTAKTSHELRTPLGSILGFAEMLRSGFDGPVTPRQGGRLTKIINTTNHLTNLINDWLDQAQLDAGRLKLNHHLISIREVAHHVDEMMQVLALKKDIMLTVHVHDDLPDFMYGDSERISQLMINLIGNAIKYTNEGQVQAAITRIDNDRWQLEVKDSGIGMSKDALPFIFDPFRQADGSTTRRHEGFGLGLSIVRQLVDLMDGQISVESELNHGSTFRIEFPILHQQINEPGKNEIVFNNIAKNKN